MLEFYVYCINIKRNRQKKFIYEGERYNKIYSPHWPSRIYINVLCQKKSIERYGVEY